MIRQLTVIAYTVAITIATILVYQIADNNLPYAPWIWSALFLAWSLMLLAVGIYLEATRNN